jgi:hypothetical protein
MKIRPLIKIQKGFYLSYDKTKTIYCKSSNEWFASHAGENIFYEPYPTLKSLIENLENAN